jgi:hypothetical protein
MDGEDLLQHRRRGALAVGPDDQDRPESPLRITEFGEDFAETLELWPHPSRPPRRQLQRK